MLHSRYQPQLEADRYISALNPGHDIEFFILIEPGLGYLIPSLRASRPNSKIVVLHADSCFRDTGIPYADVPMWFPDSGMDIQEFLEDKIPEGASARIIEWRPSLNVYGDMCLKLVRESAEFIKRAEASRRTGAAFGKRWVMNFFRNMALLDKTLQYRTLDMPIIITGSGPSLEQALPEIRASREGVFILAASSSLPALAAGGIAPDMVIATDGGGWALFHLHACFRNKPRSTRRNTEEDQKTNKDSVFLRDLRGEILDSWTPPTLLAMPLCAAVPSQCAALPVLVLNDGSLWQSMVLHSMGIPSVVIPQRGTVTASALELAMVLNSDSVFLAGMDLAVQDIKTHARPYGFDHLFSGTASRLRPLYSQYFTRSWDMKAGGSHDVYAAWFRNKLSSWSQRIFSLGGNHAVFDNLPQGNIQERRNLPHAQVCTAEPCSVDNLARRGAKQRLTLPSMREGFSLSSAPCTRTTPDVGNYFQVVTLNSSPSERRRRALETLIAALDQAEYSSALCAELAPLLFPGRSDVMPAEIAEALAAAFGGKRG
jgi:hypothetical protein